MPSSILKLDTLSSLLIRLIFIVLYDPLAKGFYEYMGVEVYKRTDLDEQGNPYPLLYMKLKKPSILV